MAVLLQVLGLIGLAAGLHLLFGPIGLVIIGGIALVLGTAIEIKKEAARAPNEKRKGATS